MSIRETVEENKEILWLEDKLEVYLYCAGRRETEVVFMVVGSAEKMGFYAGSRILSGVMEPDCYFYLGDREENMSPEDIPGIVKKTERFYRVPVRIVEWDGETLKERI